MNSPVLLIGATALAACFSLFGESPPRATPTEAIGRLDRSTPLERVAFENDPAFFDPIKPPGPNDWLAVHEEPGQTTSEYAAILSQVQPQPWQKVLCVLPLGEFNGAAPDLKLLQSYCTAYFGMETQLLKAMPLQEVPAKQRVNQNSGKRQLLTRDILSWLYSRRSGYAYAVIAVTMEDLYPEESWNFVFGQAALKGGVGVFSFARYTPAFYGEPTDGNTEKLILERSLKVLTHEMGHMFGIKHCVFFECLMNGSNHLAETDSRPMHLCPVCLRKLHMAARFDLLSREERLQAFYKASGLAAEADWSVRRIGKFRAAK